MFSSLPKLADKTFIIGFLLPVIILYTAMLWLFSDIPEIKVLAEEVGKKDTAEKLLYLVLATWSGAIVLMMLNDVIFKALEGYFWPLSSNFFKKRELDKFKAMKARLKKLGEEWKQQGDLFPALKQGEYDELRQSLVMKFPNDPKYILATRFGNAIAAFEYYPKQIYGADSIPLWLHLCAVIPKDFHAGIEDARAEVNCLLNLYFIALFILCVDLIRFAVLCVKHLHSLSAVNAFEPAAIGISSVIVAWLAYELSIERIYAWGGLIKAAFDCYLPALAKVLGYELPLCGDQRRDFWIAVSRQAIYSRPLSPERWASANGPAKEPSSPEKESREELCSENVGDGEQTDGDTSTQESSQKG